METRNEGHDQKVFETEPATNANAANDDERSDETNGENIAANNGAPVPISDQSSLFIDLGMAMALQEIFESEPTAYNANDEDSERSNDHQCAGEPIENTVATNDDDNDEVSIPTYDKSRLFRDMTVGMALLMGIIFAVAGSVAWKQSQSKDPASPRSIIAPSPSYHEYPTSEPTPWPTWAPPQGHYTETHPVGEPSDTRHHEQAPPPFSFYVMGDVPYDVKEAWVLDQQLQDMVNNRHEGSAFGVHVGDFQRWQDTGCTWQTYVDFRTKLLKSPVPMFVLAGDNDSIDCWNSTEAFLFFLDTFSTLEQWWNDRIPAGIEKLHVNRNWGHRPEMFSFIAADGILFLSTNLLNAPSEQVETEEWNARINDSARWIIQETGWAFWHHDIRGVVMFSHAEPSHILKDYYMTIWEQVFKQRPELPVLNIHGDGHVFQIDRHFSDATGWFGFTDIQVDQGGKADPLLIEVAPIRHGVMVPFREENEMQYVFGDGLFRIDRQKGRYDWD